MVDNNSFTVRSIVSSNSFQPDNLFSSHHKIFNQNFSGGTISISSTPENGMSIFLDGINTGKITPATISNIPTGTHRIRLEGKLYKSQEKTLEVVEGEVTSLLFEMIPNYASITVNSNQDAIIFVNGIVMGTTSWTGKLAAGVQKLKVSKSGYKTREFDLIVTAKKDNSIDLIMMPITGTLEIITNPPQAMISLNGRLYGLTPRVISDLPLGEYTLTLEKAEHNRVVKQISVTDENLMKIDMPLYSGKEITLTTNPPGANVIINQKTEGITPLTLWLKFGTHLIKFEKDGNAVVESITINQAGSKIFSFDLKATLNPFENQMVFVKGGSYKMGDTFGDGNLEEKPVHPVTVNDFYISKYEVTQIQWVTIMGNNPSHFSGCDNCPVERVSWLDIQTFLAKLNELTGKKFRLPTEAEWEYAAKGGQAGMGYRYAGRNNINFVSWYNGNSNSKTQPVGTKDPNELGIYDMSGNVWEWTNDWLSDYSDSPKVNPTGPVDGDYKVVRGGSWFGYIGGSRVACRGSDDPGNRRSYVGFRVALSVE